jgi:hypothetical protein
VLLPTNVPVATILNWMVSVLNWRELHQSNRLNG